MASAAAQMAFAVVQAGLRAEWKPATTDSSAKADAGQNRTNSNFHSSADSAERSDPGVLS
jgi:hypothetical protein